MSTVQNKECGLKTRWFYLKYWVAYYRISTNFKVPGGFSETKYLEAENETEAIKEARKLYLEILRAAELSKKLSKRRSDIYYPMPENPRVTDCPLSGCEGKCTAKFIVMLEITPEQTSLLVESMQLYQHSQE